MQQAILREERFRALFEYATEGILVIDHLGKIIMANPATEKLFCYDKDELTGHPIEILIPSNFKEKHKVHREHYVGNPHPRSMGIGMSLSGLRKTGEEFPVEVSLSPFTTPNGNFVIAFIIDVTIRKKNEEMVLQQKEELQRITTEIKILNTELEQKVDGRTKMLRETLSALERSKEELSEALKAEKELGELKSRFVTMASHEFRTPLSTILSSAFLLEKYNAPEDSPKRAKHIERIKSAVIDMKSILEDFLSLGRLEEGLVKANFEHFTVAACTEIINDVIHDMEYHLKPGQHIDISFTGAGVISVDKQLLKNILINLLSNAVKFSPEQSMIEISAHIDTEKLQITVKDSGIGISEEDHQHLFNRFFRAKNALNIQGTGLGLHIIAKYLDLMQGSIEVASVLNQGTAFTIKIPQNAN